MLKFVYKGFGIFSDVNPPYLYLVTTPQPPWQLILSKTAVAQIGIIHTIY